MNNILFSRILILFALTLSKDLWGATQQLSSQPSQESHNLSFNTTLKRFLPYSPPAVALSCIGSTLGLKQPYRVSTETLQGIQWGCFAASICIIAGYLLYIHQKMAVINQYMELNDAGIASNQKTAAFMQTINKEILDTIVKNQPPEKQEHIRHAIENPNGKISELLEQLQQHLQSNDNVVPGKLA